MRFFSTRAVALPSDHTAAAAQVTLDSDKGRAYSPTIVEDVSFETNFHPDEKHMGSTTFGNVNPVVTGPAMPQHIEINRAGLRRVRVTVAPS